MLKWIHTITNLTDTVYLAQALSINVLNIRYTRLVRKKL